MIHHLVYGSLIHANAPLSCGGRFYGRGEEHQKFRLPRGYGLPNRTRGRARARLVPGAHADEPPSPRPQAGVRAHPRHVAGRDARARKSSRCSSTPRSARSTRSTTSRAAAGAARCTADNLQLPLAAGLLGPDHRRRRPHARRRASYVRLRNRSCRRNLVTSRCLLRHAQPRVLPRQAAAPRGLAGAHASPRERRPGYPWRRVSGSASPRPTTTAPAHARDEHHGRLLRARRQGQGLPADAARRRHDQPAPPLPRRPAALRRADHQQAARAFPGPGHRTGEGGQPLLQAGPPERAPGTRGSPGASPTAAGSTRSPSRRGRAASPRPGSRPGRSATGRASAATTRSSAHCIPRG